MVHLQFQQMLQKLKLLLLLLAEAVVVVMFHLVLEVVEQVELLLNIFQD